jgi:hypothetical protein
LLGHHPFHYLLALRRRRRDHRALDVARGVTPLAAFDDPLEGILQLAERNIGDDRARR